MNLIFFFLCAAPEDEHFEVIQDIFHEMVSCRGAENKEEKKKVGCNDDFLRSNNSETEHENIHE